MHLYDQIIVLLHVHSVMIQAQKLLRPDGIFLAVMLGGDSLHELRNSFALAEQERDGEIGYAFLAGCVHACYIKCAEFAGLTWPCVCSI